MSELAGLVALVTGGASGIGAATARLLAERGARVAVLDRDLAVAGPGGAGSGDAGPDEMLDSPPADAGPGAAGPDDLLAVGCDVTDAAAVERAVAATVDRLGGLDVVVANAGIGATGDVTANDDAEWHRVLDVNVVGVARVVRAALPYLRHSRHAAVVTTCSAVAHVGVRDRALYSASKGAVEALTLAMAADHVADGIRVNAVSPGTADTPWVGRLLAAADDPEAAAAALRARQPLGRLVTADEVAHAVAYLASPRAASTTGTVLRVDGGMTTLRT